MNRLNRMVRWRLAATFALAYLLCVLAPPVALAFMNEGALVHCLIVKHEHRLAVESNGFEALAQHAMNHGHADVAHEHAGHSSSGHHSSIEPETGSTDRSQSAATNCCGYFCLSALPANPVPDLVPTAGMAVTVAALDRSIAGRAPDRIDRPPIALLPL